ncbi:hypothetical protein DL770_001457 [Monosporascus sp. CRB-9-2]|nr:hypothetical protein DL770_001457 [Monosporascus sp. CRB-9-2]
MAVEEKVHSSGSSETPSIEGSNTVKAPIADEKPPIEYRVEETESQRFDDKATKRLLRKIDWTLVPFLALLYLLSFLDRTNIGNARLAGLEVDLGMDPASLQYNVALSVFFPWYVAAEIPSNLAMKRFRPSVWIPIIMIAWGICCVCMGFVSNYAGLLAARMALGLAEGGLFPGVTFFITQWYKRHECGLRMAIFFSAATASGAFGGLLARGISEMSGVGGHPGWAWIFILEGIVTLVIAIIAFFVMQDYPATAKFLNPAEKQEVQRRLEEDRSALADEFDLKYFWHALRDWKIWMTVPPYVVACFFCIGAGFLADRWGQRGIFMIFFNFVAIVGFIMQISTSNNAVRYAGTFFAASGIYPNVPQGVAWNGNNIGGSTKRGVGIAMHVGFGNLGGAISGFLYQAKHRPEYYPGHGTLIATLSMSLILCTIMTLYLRRENARRDSLYKAPSEYTAQEKWEEREKGDYATFFRYTV